MRNAQPLTLVLTALNIGVLILGLAQHSPASAPSDATILRGRGLELVDASGRIRAQFTVEPNGEGVFRMRDQEGTIRVKLGASDTGSALLLLDQATEPAVHLRAGSEKTSLTLKGSNGKQRVITPQD
jgi:hypothetical protein